MPVTKEEQEKPVDGVSGAEESAAQDHDRKNKESILEIVLRFHASYHTFLNYFPTGLD